ncbi:T9SS type A sorting domain-containing protein [candidate division KSB1 bacterium]|nr:T9SS type A sorting domain-containing protein [candidate division KSB1 bacterium]
MKKTIVICILLSAALMAAETRIYTLIQVPFFSPETDPVRALQKLGADITCYDSKQGLVEAVVTTEEMMLLKKSGYPVISQIDNLQKHVENLANEDYFKHFFTYDQIIAEIRRLVDQYPGIIALYDIGDTYEKEFNLGGFDIYAVKISDNVAADEADEAEILFTGAIHAREIITPEIILFFIHYLVDGYASDPYVTFLVNNREMWFVPVVNPDGHTRVLTGHYEAVTTYIDYLDPIWWRKNKRDNDLNVVFDPRYDGVDLNRNFGYMWGYDNSGSSPFGSDETYRGTFAFSEPEAQAIRDFVNGRHFIISLFYHSYSRLLLYPFGYARVDPPEPDLTAFRTLADSCTAYNGYYPGNFASGAIYSTNGDTDDWLYAEKGVFAFTPEVGSIQEGRFWPDTSVIVSQIMENLGPNLYMAWAAGEEPIVGHTRIEDSENRLNFYSVFATIKKPVLLTENSPLDETTFKVFYTMDKSGPFTSELLQPDLGDGTYRADIPGERLEGKVYYYISASDERGRTGSSPRGAPMAVDSFQVAFDRQGPFIRHKPLSFLSPSQTPVFTAEVSDNLGIDSTWLELRVNGGPSRYFGGQLEGDNYTYTLHEDSLRLVEGDSVQYRIWARDISALANITAAPAEGWYFFGVYTTLSFYDFETDAVCTTGNPGDWEWGIPQSGPQLAFSGQKLWATKLNGDYSNNTTSYLYLPVVPLSPDLGHAAFQCMHWYETETRASDIVDGGNIKVSVDGGPFQVVVPERGYNVAFFLQNDILGNEPGFGGDGQAWQKVRINLKDYIGHSVQLAFFFGSDNDGTASGWYLDDLQFLVYYGLDSVVDKQRPAVADRFSLSPNFPNPFNSGTQLEYRVAREDYVEIAVYNTLGQKIKILVAEKVLPGDYSIFWDGRDSYGINMPSGIYWVKMNTQNASYVQKMLYLR